ncbi:MAG: glycosyltransferase family 4 protein [Rhodospirillales bacterium]|nr:glycosyltransferase family 4 protein [Rhodospirillales bacterium]
MDMDKVSIRPKLLFVVTEDWYFYSHRLPMVRAAQRAGFDVAVVTHVNKHQAAIESAGVRVIPFSFERRSLNPFKALGHIARLKDIYREEKPDVVHHIAMKPVLYGAVAAWLSGGPRVVNAFAGLGFLFTAQTVLARFLRLALYGPFRFLLRRRGSLTLFQNVDDREALIALGLAAPENSVVIRGSGVDLEVFPFHPWRRPEPDFICVYAGRMIDIKGLPTMQAAFAILKDKAPQVKLWLCGRPDPANPGSWDEPRLRAWAADNPCVTYKGACAMEDIWPQAHLAVQASYGGEGVPKSLLEAAASGRPIIASDTPGCREVVADGENGFLVPPYDAVALADKIMALAGDYERCVAMGQASRKLVEGDLSAEGVARQAEALYRRFLED